MASARYDVMSVNSVHLNRPLGNAGQLFGADMNSPSINSPGMMHDDNYDFGNKNVNVHGAMLSELNG